jgi:ureidoacrylate peracid hydrolase
MKDRIELSVLDKGQEASMDALSRTDKTALIVVDMQNAYLHPDGSFARLWPDANNQEVRAIDPVNDPIGAGRQFDLGLLRRAIPGTKRLIEGARFAGVPVIFLRYVYRADYKDGGVLIHEINPALATVGYVVDGSWDAEILEELKPDPRDFVVEKSRYSGFHATRLETVLRSLGTESLVICGVTTHFCVECTARDAHMRDYRVVIASDATDEVNEIWKQTALASFGYGFGWVATVDEVVEMWKDALKF